MAPVRLATELKAAWEDNPGDALWESMKERAGHYEVNVGTLLGLEWITTQEVTSYDQFATLELTTPLSQRLTRSTTWSTT